MYARPAACLQGCWVTAVSITSKGMFVNQSLLALSLRELVRAVLNPWVLEHLGVLAGRGFVPHTSVSGTFC